MNGEQVAVGFTVAVAILLAMGFPIEVAFVLVICAMFLAIFAMLLAMVTDGG